MSRDFDLDAYCRRIGYTGPRTPTIETLRAIVGHHAQAIPFENLNPLLRWPVALDLPSLQEKIVRGGRGGYCFEQNLLLRQALQACGFQATGLAARVLWNQPESALTPRGHMLLRIDLESEPLPLIVDVGFGGLTLTGVLRLEADVEQPTPHEPFRLIAVGPEFLMQAQIAGTWKTLYRFALQEQLLVDYEVTSWYLCHHPSSHFRSTLLVARAAPGRRYVLRNNEFAVHDLAEGTERRRLTSVAALREVMEQTFQLRVPVGPELDEALARFVAGVLCP